MNSSVSRNIMTYGRMRMTLIRVAETHVTIDIWICECVWTSFLVMLFSAIKRHIYTHIQTCSFCSVFADELRESPAFTHSIICSSYSLADVVFCWRRQLFIISRCYPHGVIIVVRYHKNTNEGKSNVLLVHKLMQLC